MAKCRMDFINGATDVYVRPWGDVFREEFDFGGSGKIDLSVPKRAIFGNIAGPLRQSDIKRKIDFQISQVISDAGNRLSRRRAKSQMLRRGSYSPHVLSALETIRSNQRKLALHAPDVIPAIDAIFDLAMENITEDQANSIFVELLCDPAKLCAASIYAEMDDVFGFRDLLWGESEKLKKHLQGLVGAISNLCENSGAEVFRKIRHEISEKMNNESYISELGTILAGRQVDPKDLTRMPALKYFIKQLILIFDQKISTFANPLSPSFRKAVKIDRGDFADLTHAVYAPYVDVFCCDSATSARLKQVGYEGTICVTEADILDAI
jgi:hypothetical protein